MIKSHNHISKEDCIHISNKIRDDIYRPANNYKTTIFLCGADISQKEKLRYKIAELLKPEYWIDIIYPEDIFEELLYSSRTKDLLSLEGILANSVDAIVLIPESPGSFAELGAFSNDETLRKKLICVLDEKYKKDKSFINQGPLKLVKKSNSSNVLFINPVEVENGIDRLTSALRKMKRNSTKHHEKISLLQLDNFLLPSIYLLEPVTVTTLINIVASATEDEKNAFQTATTALTMLIKKRYIQLTSEGYKITTLGLESLSAFQKTRTRIKRQDEKSEIDNLRLEILNLRNRNKRLKV